MDRTGPSGPRAPAVLLIAALLALAALAGGCSEEPADNAGPLPLKVPHGYMATLRLNVDGNQYRFGPFVGYYFRPQNPDDLTRVDFVCFNERKWYTLDQPENARLYEGTAVMTRLPDHPSALPAEGGRIRPVFFDQAPPEWLDTRPEPVDEYLHFHSCHDGTGPVMTGFWIRHVAVADFTYDMGGRVEPSSPLYHKVQKGPDKKFPRIVEFDQGQDKK